MKKILLLACISMAALLASADNYFTMGENDTLRINPIYLGLYYNVAIRAHFDGRLDQWNVKIKTRTKAIEDMVTVSRGPDMDVHYLDSQGRDTVYEAPLNYLRSANNDSLINELSSLISVIGYWDYDSSGHYAPYGTVKWEAGDYDCMFTMDIKIEQSFRSDTITFDYKLDTGGDARGGIIAGYTYSGIKRVFVYIGLQRGDVDGNETVGMGDLSELTNYLLSYEGLSEFQLAAADMNGDGNVDMDDLTILTNVLLTQ